MRINWDYKPSSGMHTVLEEVEVGTVVERHDGGEKYGNNNGGGGGNSGNGGQSRGRSIGGSWCNWDGSCDQIK